MMRKWVAMGMTALILGFGGTASAATVTDPTGDFLPSYTGSHDGDLDVTSFSVNFDSGTSTFLLDATLAGAIHPDAAGLYAIGVDTGAGANAPFGSIGAPHVIFDQIVVVQKNGTGMVTGASGGPLASGAISINGNEFSVRVPLGFLPTTGFDPMHYGFNLWPRDGIGNNDQISDFAPDNATAKVDGGVPEPATWAMMITGFGFTGAALRRRRTAARWLPKTA
jgi:PEP-CTERM motif